MPTDVAVACGGAAARPPGDFPAPTPVALSLAGPVANVRLRLDDLHAALHETVAPVPLDLLELAAYVYAADLSVKRGTAAGDPGGRWRRRFHFTVPVRCPERWNAPALTAALADALSFLTDDEYRFAFVPRASRAPAAQYIDFGGAADGGRVDEVALYSAGLDSLAGAVDAAVNRGRRVLLVNHRSHEKRTPAFERSVAELRRRFGPHAPLSLPVHANKAERLTKDDNQRSRLFLYAALGAVAARLVGLDSLRVYENGVVGLNLPLLGQLVGSRASRTTHPLSLALMGRFLTELFGTPFAIENPFLWLTKADVVRVIDDAGQADLIGPSVSCGQTIGRSNRHTHCGACSQCLDRRFGVLAAGLAGHDPAGQYEIDLVTGERTRDADRAMLVGYLDRARRVAGMDPAGFFAAYGEAARVLPRGLGRAGEVASRVYDLYRRHADEVLGVVAGVIRGDADRLARGAGGPSPLVALSIEPPRPAAEVPVGEPDYLFRKGGDFWAVRFAGSETKYVNDSEGMRLIATLLGRPHAEVGALELLGVTPRPPGTPAPQAGLTLTDGASLADYRRAVKAVEGQIEQAREARDFEDLEGLELQRDTLLRHIRSVTTIEGKLRAASSDPERARKLVVNNVGNAVKALRKHLPALADHHRLTLKRGAVSRYAPATPVPWEF